MTHRWRPALLAGLFMASTVLPLHAVPPPASDPGVTFIGRGLVPGNTLDLSGLQGHAICQKDDEDVCIDQATFGGWGSGMTYTGFDNVFLAVPDRGPFDGRTDVPYLDRFHFLHIAIDSTAALANNVKVTLLDTRFLKDEQNRSFVGDAYAFAPDYLRLDPEGVRATPDGNFVISDEYGPFLFKFDRNGHLLQRLPVPDYYLIANPSGDIDNPTDAASVELYHTNNTSGRQANRGMEGLALTPDGQWLVGIMQNALIQDSGLDYKGAASIPPGTTGAKSPGRLSLNNRIYMLNLTTGETHEYVYPIDTIGKGRGVNELIAINSHEFLVLERDNQTLVPTPPNAASAPAEKRLYRIDLNESGITDVAGIDTLPLDLTSQSIKPVTKTLFLDLLNPAYTIDGTTPLANGIAEKIEGVAWGPNLPDGRRLLYVVSDNDLFAGDASHPSGLPTQIYAFAITESEAGIDIVQQHLPGPLFPPGQVKKIVGK